MSPIPLSDSDSLAAFAARLETAPFVALDTEFMRERTYRPQLCLLQLATPNEAHCVDPLAGVALDVLTPALSRQHRTENPARRAPGPRGPVAGVRSDRPRVRYPGCSGARGHAGPDRLQRAGPTHPGRGPQEGRNTHRLVKATA